jgi:hypothetical protein
MKGKTINGKIDPELSSAPDSPHPLCTLKSLSGKS